MQRSMALVQCRSMSLPPKEAVLLYRHFYVMQNVLQYSETLAQSFRTAYAEEFRYNIFLELNSLIKKIFRCVSSWHNAWFRQFIACDSSSIKY